jgi:hypothetical protein
MEDAMDYLRYAERSAEHSEQMDAMMAQRGVDRTTAQNIDGELGWLTARAKCIFCQKADVCSKWLRGEDSGTNPVDFCPNSAFFAQCHITKPAI